MLSQSSTSLRAQRGVVRLGSPLRQMAPVLFCGLSLALVVFGQSADIVRVEIVESQFAFLSTVDQEYQIHVETGEAGGSPVQIDAVGTGGPIVVDGFEGLLRTGQIRLESLGEPVSDFQIETGIRRIRVDLSTELDRALEVQSSRDLVEWNAIHRFTPIREEASVTIENLHEDQNFFRVITLESASSADQTGDVGGFVFASADGSALALTSRPKDTKRPLAP